MFPRFDFSRASLVAVAALLLAGCAMNSGHRPASKCPANFPAHYVDQVHKFSLCLPAHLHAGNAGAYPAGSKVFAGFAVPAGTNLESKELAIVPGAYDVMQYATALSDFTANGVTFTRARFEEGSAGHSHLHVIYTWKDAGGQLHFDFVHHAVNVGVFDPANRPAEYDVAAQMQIARKIMATFHRLP